MRKLRQEHSRRIPWMCVCLGWEAKGDKRSRQNADHLNLAGHWKNFWFDFILKMLEIIGE